MTSLNQLFVDTPRWVHRKVESTKFAADGATRVQMSMDFTLPQAAVDFKVLPLGFLKKQTLHSFDISDASGAALSLLTRTQNTDLAIDLLLENSEDALTLNDRSLLKRIVHSAPNEIPEGMKAYSDLISLGEILDSAPQEIAERVLKLANIIQGNYIFATIPHSNWRVGGRYIIKYSYVESQSRFDRRTGRRRLIPVETDWAHSTHFELQAPEHCVVGNLIFLAEKPHDSMTPLELSLEPLGEAQQMTNEIAHISTDHSDEVKATYVFFEILPKKTGITLLAPVICLSNLVILLAPIVIHVVSPHWISSEFNAAAMALLLLFPTALMAVFNFRPEHAATKQALRAPRLYVFAPGILFFLAAVLASGILVPTATWTLWYLLAFCSFAINISLAIWWYRTFIGVRTILGGWRDS